MKRLKASAVLIALCAAGCVHRAPKTAMGSWIGHPDSELIESWGQPDETVPQADGTHISTWFYRYSEFPPGQEPIGHTCRRSFVIARNGRLLKWSIVGGCAAH